MKLMVTFMSNFAVKYENCVQRHQYAIARQPIIMENLILFNVN